MDSSLLKGFGISGLQSAAHYTIQTTDFFLPVINTYPATLIYSNKLSV